MSDNLFHGGETMILQQTSNKNMYQLIGMNFGFLKQDNGKTRFFVIGSNPQIYFESTVTEAPIWGNTYIVKTEHSEYRFELLPGEQVGPFGIINRPHNALWEFEHSIAN